MTKKGCRLFFVHYLLQRITHLIFINFWMKSASPQISSLLILTVQNPQWSTTLRSSTWTNTQWPWDDSCPPRWARTRRTPYSSSCPRDAARRWRSSRLSSPPRWRFAQSCALTELKTKRTPLKCAARLWFTLGPLAAVQF